jgi:hypothetical protein
MAAVVCFGIASACWACVALGYGWMGPVAAGLTVWGACELFAPAADADDEED